MMSRRWIASAKCHKGRDTWGHLPGILPATVPTVTECHKGRDACAAGFLVAAIRSVPSVPLYQGIEDAALNRARKAGQSAPCGESVALEARRRKRAMRATRATLWPACRPYRRPLARRAQSQGSHRGLVRRRASLLWASWDRASLLLPAMPWNGPGLAVWLSAARPSRPLMTRCHRQTVHRFHTQAMRPTLRGQRQGVRSCRHSATVRRFRWLRWLSQRSRPSWIEATLSKVTAAAPVSDAQLTQNGEDSCDREPPRDRSSLGSVAKVHSFFR